MFIGKSGSDARRTRKDSSSGWGIALHAMGVVIIWICRRPFFAPLFGNFTPTRFVAPIVAVILAAGSVYFSWVSLKTLGTQWSFIAGVTAKHRLIQEGPYSLVRHPLYLCFFGLTLATGMVWTAPLGLLVGMIVFGAGVWIRVHSEEKILRQTFGAEFDEYKKRVPAFFPFL